MSNKKGQTLFRKEGKKYEGKLFKQACLGHTASALTSGYLLDCIWSCTTHKAKHNIGSECDIHIGFDTNE